MTDPADERDVRAEDAFRGAFTQHAEALEPADLTARDERGRRWPLLMIGGAAAAVLAVVATLSVINAADDAGRPDPSTDAPTAGLRTVGYRDLELDVPQEWASVPTPNANGCGYPQTPFVAVYDPTQGFEANLCLNNERPRPPVSFPNARFAEWTPNVQLSPVAAAAESLPDGTEGFRGWTLTRTTVGAVRVEILTDAETADVVEPILASARTVEVDLNGCETTSPAQAVELVRPAAFDLAAVDSARRISVCQYLRGDPTVSGLMGSSRLEGSAAADELQAIQDAPDGGGPDHRDSCVSDLFGDQVIVLRLADDSGALGDVYVYYDWCFGNGFDDGTTRRAITAENCPALFGGAVQQYGGDGSTYALCHPQGS